MQVSNLLANKNQDVATISQERTVNDALMLLKERSIGALVGVYVGWKIARRFE